MALEIHSFYEQKAHVHVHYLAFGWDHFSQRAKLAMI